MWSVYEVDLKGGVQWRSALQNGGTIIIKENNNSNNKSQICSFFFPYYSFNKYYWSLFQPPGSMLTLYTHTVLYFTLTITLGARYQLYGQEAEISRSHLSNVIHQVIDRAKIQPQSQKQEADMQDDYEWGKREDEFENMPRTTLERNVPYFKKQHKISYLSILGRKNQSGHSMTKDCR